MPSSSAHCVCAACGDLLRATRRLKLSSVRYDTINTIPGGRSASSSFESKSFAIKTRPISSYARARNHESAVDPANIASAIGQPRPGRYSRTRLDSASDLQTASSSSQHIHTAANGITNDESRQSDESSHAFQNIIPTRTQPEHHPRVATTGRKLVIRRTTEHAATPRRVNKRLPAITSRSNPTELVSDTQHDQILTDSSPDLGFQVPRPLALKDQSMNTRLIVRIGRAIEAQNAKLLEKVFEEMKAESTVTSSKEPLPLTTYEHLLRACLTLRLPRLAMEVLGAIVQAGLTPTVKTWTIMIRGASRISQPHVIDHFWRSMLDSGISPDVAVWSARIFALANTRQPDKAYDALREMGQKWITYQSTPHYKTQEKLLPSARSYSSAKPDISVANAAISAFSAHARSEEFIPKVLAWAGRYGLQPDVSTFNILINLSMRNGDVDEAMGILRQMKERKVEPDSQTLTVVLTKLFWSNVLDGLDNETQTSYLMGFIDDLEKNYINARMDVKGYAMAIDRMLKHHNNRHAAQALLARMRAQNMKPTPHIYTVLLTHHLANDPPDYAAAETLWVDIAFANKGYGATLDAVFYDRALELFAPHHNVIGISKILEVLEHIRKSGKQPSWPALHSVAKVFAERKDINRLSSLVDDVLFSRGVVASGVSQSYGQLDFWQFILSTGILDEDKISLVEQRLQNKRN